jgi:hypothetical protein
MESLKNNVSFFRIEYFSWFTSFGLIKNRYVTHSKSPTLALSFSLSQIEAKATVDVEIIFFKFFLAKVKTTGCTDRNKLSLSELGSCHVCFVYTKIIVSLTFPLPSTFSSIIDSIVFIQKEQLHNLDFLSYLLSLLSVGLISFFFPMTTMLVSTPMTMVVRDYMTFPLIRGNKNPS